ncbi:uncharacterized protein LOC110453548 [Mizuhopecten yessoensis]|uniref:uncharacterized protein LOC110453548 n=1 Tax=Mizuhopecten yessoensis TaxID=6573 RepID=UPI000B45B7A6|nr:uncharacterized protein LOC110453548 [Mizuhopecten yessoensis]
MKITLAFLAALVAVVVSETCVDKSRCEKTSCSTDYSVECVDIMGVHVCTCMHTQIHGGCTGKNDCNGIPTFVTSCPIESQRHCVDGNCRCETPTSHGHHHGNGFGNSGN